MEHSESLGDLFAAMSKAQADIKKARRNQKNAHLGNEYADLESVLDVVRPVLKEHSLTVIQQPVHADGMSGVITWVGHTSGQWIRSTLLLPMGGRGTNATQMAGACLSYARRYSLSSIFAVAVGDDTDGEIGRERHSEAWNANRGWVCGKLGKILNCSDAYEIAAKWSESKGWGRPSGWDKADDLKAWMADLEKGGAFHDELCMFAADYHAGEKR